MKHKSIKLIYTHLSTVFATIQCVNYVNDNHSQFSVNDNHYQLKKRGKMKKPILSLIAFLMFTGVAISNEVNIFSARHYDSDIQLYEKFTSFIIVLSHNFSFFK